MCDAQNDCEGAPSHSVAFSAQGGTVAVASDYCAAFVFKVETGELLARHKHDAPGTRQRERATSMTIVGRTVRAVAYAPNGNALATASNDGYVAVFGEQTHTLAYRVAAHRDWINALAFSADSKLVRIGVVVAVCS